MSQLVGFAISAIPSDLVGKGVAVMLIEQTEEANEKSVLSSSNQYGGDDVT